MPRKTIDDDNNGTISNQKGEKESLLVKNKQPEEQLSVGQDIETEVLEEKDDEIISSLTPTKQKVDEQLSKAKGKRKRGKEKRLVKHTTKLVESRLTSDLKRELAKQASNIDQITKILKPLQKYTIMIEKQFKSIKQIEVQIKQLQKQTFDILKVVRKVK
jgi:hypothetical protein